MNALTGNNAKQLLFWLLLLIVFKHSSVYADTGIYHPPTLIEDADDLKEKDTPGKGYQKEIKFVALQVGSNYGNPPFIPPQERFGPNQLVLTEVSRGPFKPLQLDHRIRLQRYIFPFHFFW